MARTKTKTKGVKTAAKSAAKKAARKAKAAPRKVAAKTKTVAAKTKKSAAKPAKVAKSAAPRAKSSAKTKLGRAAKTLAKVAGTAAAVTVAATLATKATAKAKTNFADLMSPLEDRLLVMIEGASDRTAGGLIIPGTVDERPNRGRVVAVGPGTRNKKGQLRPLDVRVGETVLFAPSAGSTLTLAGAELLVIRESELLGVVG